MVTQSKWWFPATQVYSRYCASWAIAPSQLDKLDSAFTKSGIALSDGKEVVAIANFKKRSIMGIKGRRSFAELGIVSVNRVTDESENVSVELGFEFDDEDIEILKEIEQDKFQAFTQLALL